ncbi:macro domain-containing protein [Candidatus Magnetomonas plexicatena]|uniref:macro domain-containing protein n=1 Tax=Candidatus Magnetomonas plexicatena TaxID=2552947 RepID=UPI0011043458|nr:macro domain-containing protein [Nitrospirales bacterium LBB_01]
MEIIIEKSVTGGMLKLLKGDITQRNTDAIVNAANSHLQHGGGVAGAIVRKGGAIIQAESDAIGYVPVGGAALTSSGTLPCKAVIHAVGPRMGEGDEDNKLKNAIRNSLTLASEKGFNSVSMPAISSGIFGFPKDRCAKILVTESFSFLNNNPESSVKIVEFCIYDPETLQCFVNEFDRI